MRTPRSILGPALVAAALLVAACGDDGGSADDTTTTTAPTTASSDTTASTDTTTTAPPGLTLITERASDAVGELKAAWEANDRPRALAVAPVAVVDELLALPSGGYEVYGCDTGEFETSSCNYRSRSEGIQISVTARRFDAGWQIESIHVSRD